MGVRMGSLGESVEMVRWRIGILINIKEIDHDKKQINGNE